MIAEKRLKGARATGFQRDFGRIFAKIVDPTGKLTRELRLAILRSSCRSWELEEAAHSDMALSSCTGSWVLSSSNSLLDAVNSHIASCSSLIESKGVAASAEPGLGTEWYRAAMHSEGVIWRILFSL
ncbi:hypothetical protein MA16_Dca026752 [Dendrobium catenatum]|uniref:Uncharacterized protein n=1 Tax=Dendrobium catenatum TaxID=906689 RepID=A0A2I0XAJ0_9ASPA|nr:hypothetical protein MA16_Dca026752 [Dendrobium catenatum]